MSGTRGSLDANVILRLLIRDVPDQHRRALALLAEGRFTVSDAALIEVIFVIGRHYRLDRAEQHAAIHDLLAQPMIDGENGLFDAAFAIYRQHPKLSFEDCYLVTLAEHRGEGPLWTFDRKLASQTSSELVPNF